MSVQLFLLICGWTGGGEGLGAGWWGHIPASRPRRGWFMSPPKEPHRRLTCLKEHASSSLCKEKTSAGGARKLVRPFSLPLLPCALLAHECVPGPCRGWCRVRALHQPPIHVPGHRHRKSLRNTWPKSLYRLICISLPCISSPASRLSQLLLLSPLSAAQHFYLCAPKSVLTFSFASPW